MHLNCNCKCNFPITQSSLTFFLQLKQLKWCRRGQWSNTTEQTNFPQLTLTSTTGSRFSYYLHFNFNYNFILQENKKEYADFFLVQTRIYHQKSCNCEENLFCRVALQLFGSLVIWLEMNFPPAGAELTTDNHWDSVVSNLKGNKPQRWWEVVAPCSAISVAHEKMSSTLKIAILLTSVCKCGKCYCFFS